MALHTCRAAASFNKRNDRLGTVWSDRFKSILVEPGSDALSHMAAYIDLNPVRANMVDDPMEYRWSGYGEAMAGQDPACRGLERLYTSDGTLALGFGMDGRADRDEFEGWSGTGDIPASGTSSTLGPFTITRASSLKWHWRQINLAVDGDMDVQIQDVRNGMLTWPSGAGFQYRIEAAEEVFGPYNTLAENLAATPPENTYQLLGHPKSGAHFFRVVRTPQ